MQKSLRFLIAAVLIGLGIWGWRVLFPSPERVIRRRLAALAATASFQPEQGMVLRTYKAGKLIGFFTTDAVINLDSRGYDPRTLTGRDELQQATLAASRYDGITIEFLDVNVTLGPYNQTAIANLTARATVEGQRDFFVQEFNFMLKKVGGQWLIYRIESVKTLSQLRFQPSATLGQGFQETFPVGIIL